jgi:hypothetical protein
MQPARAAVEVEGWGDLRGFRIDGQLFPVTTSIRVVPAGGKTDASTGHWQERDLKYLPDGDQQIYSGKFAFRQLHHPIDYQTTITPLAPNRVKIVVQVLAPQNMKLDEIDFSVSVPLSDFAGATANLIGLTTPTTQASAISTTQPATDRLYLTGDATAANLQAGHTALALEFDSPRHISIHDQHDPKGDTVILRVTIQRGDIAANQKITAGFTLTSSGDIDHQPAHLAIDTTKIGSPLAGLGGNFVFFLDSPEVAYDLKNIPVIWARMAVPLTTWDPNESSTPDPATLAQNDTPDSDIRQSLQLARVFSQRHISLIFTLWRAPQWALMPIPDTDPYAGRRKVNPAKWDQFCNAIASYLLYARQKYGVEPKFFSFNESDLGITILFTPQEYRDAVKRIGASFAAHGISTKLLLGDVSSPKPADFITPASLDPQAMQYVGAISFHSWNGAIPDQLTAWHDAACRLNLPLIVAEGGTDSDSYHYTHVWAYPWYAIDEAGMYLDLLRFSQPLSVLPWEMTQDYGMVDFHDPDPRPTMRFWCLKQLASTTPFGACELPISLDISSIHAAALYDPTTAALCIHLANLAAARQVTITGIPASIASLQTFITSDGHSFSPSDTVRPENGTAQITLPALSYLTLTTQQVTPTSSAPPSR